MLQYKSLLQKNPVYYFHASLIEQVVIDTFSNGRATKKLDPPKSSNLLKTALANRLQPMLNNNQNQQKPQKTTEKKAAEEMNTSILRNPAWYRDSDGRTGYGPRDLQTNRKVQQSEIKVNLIFVNRLYLYCLECKTNYQCRCQATFTSPTYQRPKSCSDYLRTLHQRTSIVGRSKGIL